MIGGMTDDDDLGLRERKKRETRVALSQATVRLSIERGWANVTVEDIAAAANVSVRTFRNYFSGKAEAVAALHLERALRIADELRARPASEPLWDAIAGAVQAQYTVDRQDDESTPERGWLSGVQLVLTEPAVQGEVLKADAAVRDELAKAIAERLGLDPVRDVYPKLVAAVVNAGSAVAVGHWLYSGPTGPVGPVLREALEQITAGLPVP